MAFYFLPLFWLVIILVFFYAARNLDNKNRSAIEGAVWAVAVFFGSYFLPCLGASRFCRHPSVLSAAAAAVLQGLIGFGYLRLSEAFSASRKTVFVYQVAAGIALFYLLLVFFSYFPYLGR